MGIRSRRKGANGERELISLLKDYLGDDTIRRNLEQTRDGGQDVLGVEGWVIEAKRAAKPNLSAWWAQAVEQAKGKGEPALAYRIDRRPWRVMISMQAINPDFPPWGAILDNGLDYCIEMSVPAFCVIVREGL